MKENLVFTGAKIGDLMKSAMSGEGCCALVRRAPPT